MMLDDLLAIEKVMGMNKAKCDDYYEFDTFATIWGKVRDIS